MERYNNFYTAVQSLHERGFCQDFVLFDNSLYWTQEKQFIDAGDFTIEECHAFAFPGELERRDDLYVFAIAAGPALTRGLLLNHYTYTSSMPAIMLVKLNQMGYYRDSLKRRSTQNVVTAAGTERIFPVK